MWQICHDVAGLPSHVDTAKATVEIMQPVLSYLQESDLLEKIANSRYADRFNDDDIVRASKDVLRDLSRDIANWNASEPIDKTELQVIVRKNKRRRLGDELERQRLDGSTLDQFLDFILFICQAVYQHTSAYAEIHGTERFEHLYANIRKQTAI